MRFIQEVFLRHDKKGWNKNHVIIKSMETVVKLVAARLKNLELIFGGCILYTLTSQGEQCVKVQL